MIFKICCHFSEMHFSDLCKNFVSTDIWTFLVCISRVDHIVTIRTKIWMKTAFKKPFLQKMIFFFSLKLCNTTKVFQNTANLKSISMQTTSDKMHFDAPSRLDRKMQFKTRHNQTGFLPVVKAPLSLCTLFISHYD